MMVFRIYFPSSKSMHTEPWFLNDGTGRKFCIQNFAKFNLPDLDALGGLFIMPLPDMFAMLTIKTYGGVLSGILVYVYK